MMASSFEFILNGQTIHVQNCSPNTTLLQYLRDYGLTGSKEGCAEGDCGACSVAIVDHNSTGENAWRAINSCLIPICLLAGREVVSVEGVACAKKLHPVQQQMVECHGSQCGYCTPGFIMSLFEGYYRSDIHTKEDVDDQLCGNLCRCTGYRSISEAASAAFARGNNDEDAFKSRLNISEAVLKEVGYESKGEQFFRPTSLADLLQYIQQFPDARLVAGATELGLDITKKYKKFPKLISVEAVSELKTISANEIEWTIGSAATLSQIEEKLGGEFPVLKKMLRVFGSRQIRNRATMGGNIVTASPIGDSAPVLIVLGASVVIASQNSERRVAMDDFFISYRKTALKSGEILKSIVIPRQVGKGKRILRDWFKVSKRKEMDISTVAGCFSVELDEHDSISGVCLAYGGVAATPVRARKTEAALMGKNWNVETIENALAILRTEFSPISDVRSGEDFRRELISSLLGKFFYEKNEAASPVTDEALLEKPFVLSQLNIPHESAHKHVTGEAIYTDDQTAAKGMLEVWPVCSPHAHAKILHRDVTAARQMPGIKAVLLAEDIPGRNDVGAVVHDEILLADKEVFFHGHPVALVVGDSQELCRAAAEKVIVEYEPIAPVLSLTDAIAKNSFHNDPNFMRRGNIDESLQTAPKTLEGIFEFGGQEHFYLETHAAWAQPGEDDAVTVTSSTQHPSEVQNVVAHVLRLPIHKVVVQSPRMGGGFGGKETQANTPAALAALAARVTKRAVRVRFNRDQDMMLSGHRHPFLAEFKVGFDLEGNLIALKAKIFSNGGWSLDLSQAVTDRALFHIDNAYYIPHVEVQGRVAKTNLSSNTAFRGFGGPQGMLIIEEIIDRVARELHVSPEIVRERNLYRGKGETNTTHYGQEIEDNRIQTIWHDLKASSDFQKRREEIKLWNQQQPHRKRGLAITPVKFGISFTVTHLNQAGAFVLLYQDGTAQINHGGTEMGQGIHTNMMAIVAKELGLLRENIRVMHTSTDKVPNTSATAASSGTDLNGAAVKNACEKLRDRLLPVALRLLSEKFGIEPTLENICLVNGAVFDRNETGKTIPLADVFTAAYLARISLSATGFYATPGIHWDRNAGKGKPFHYFAYGAAVSEVEVDGFTGMSDILRTDILHDAGDSLNESINRGQIEGGFVQGAGWLTMEELKWDDKGRLLTHSPDTYKIPAIGDRPKIFNVAFLKKATQETVVHGSKAVGEPPLMLAISVREAIRDAVAAFGNGGQVELASPATCEAIYLAIRKVKSL